MSFKYNEDSFEIRNSHYFSVDLDGVNDLVDLTSDTGLWSTSLTKFSIAFWIVPDTLADTVNDRVVVSHGGTSNQAFRVFLDLTDATKIRWVIKNSVGTTLTASSQDITGTSNLHHIVCTYDNSLGSANMKIYVNGVLGNVTANLTETLNLVATLTLGDSSNDYDGKIWDFRFWKTKALSQTEVTELYNEIGQEHIQKTTEGKLPSYWLPMHEGTGNPTDILSAGSGSPKVGTLTNGATWHERSGVGGPPDLSSAGLIDMNAPNNLWPAGTAGEQIGGNTRYRIFYVRNVGPQDFTNSGVFLRNVSLVLHQATKKTGYTSFQWAFDPLAYKSYAYRPYKYFNGTSDFIKVDEKQPGALQEDAYDLEAGFVLACWFRTYLGKDFSNDGNLIAKGSRFVETAGSNLNYGLWMNGSEQIAGGYEEGAGTDHIVTSVKTYNDGFWHHAIIAWDAGAGVRLYIDGFKVGSVASANAPELNDQPICIGKDFPSNSRFFEGWIDETRLWSDSGSFTDAQARDIYWNNQTVLAFENSYIFERKFGTDNGCIDYFAQMLPRVTGSGSNGAPRGNVQWIDESQIIPDPPNVGLSNNAHFFPVIGKWVINPNSGDIQNDLVIFNYYWTAPPGVTTDGGSGDPGNPPSGGSGEPSTPPSNNPTTICACADWGLENTTDDIVAMIKAEDPDCVLDCGDKGYNSVPKWHDGPVKDIQSLILDSVGNHDDAGDCMNMTNMMGQRHFYQNKKATYYYRVVENIAIIAMDTEASFSSSSTQGKAILSFFDEIKQNKSVLWKIVFFHKPMFGTPNDSHGYNEGNFVQTWQPVFDANDVDIVCCGHVHNYERTYPVKYNSNDPTNPRATDTSDGPYDQADGAIVVRNGTGGHDSGNSLYKFTASQKAFTKYMNDDENGITIMKWTNNNRTVTGTFKTLDKKVRDTWVMTK